MSSGPSRLFRRNPGGQVSIAFGVDRTRDGLCRHWPGRLRDSIVQRQRTENSLGGRKDWRFVENGGHAHDRHWSRRRFAACRCIANHDRLDSWPRLADCFNVVAAPGRKAVAGVYAALMRLEPGCALTS